MSVIVRTAAGSDDMAAAAGLFREYQQWLGVDLCFQGFEQELASLPGAYAPPEGSIYLAEEGCDAAGCIAVRPVAGPTGGGSFRTCEMKRLFVRAPWRGTGLGRRLAEESMRFARDAGYGRMLLDTLPHLQIAKDMYLRMGFSEIAPYYENPLPGVVYMEKIL